MSFNVPSGAYHDSSIFIIPDLFQSARRAVMTCWITARASRIKSLVSNVGTSVALVTRNWWDGCKQTSLIHCDLVTPYGIIELGQHWFGLWWLTAQIHSLVDKCEGGLIYLCKYTRLISKHCIKTHRTTGWPISWSNISLDSGERTRY